MFLGTERTYGSRDVNTGTFEGIRERKGIELDVVMYTGTGLASLLFAHWANDSFEFLQQCNSPMEIISAIGFMCGYGYITHELADALSITKIDERDQITSNTL